jgi:hypothetical protein
MCQNKKKRHKWGTRKRQSLPTQEHEQEKKKDDYGNFFTIHKLLDMWIVANLCD